MLPRRSSRRAGAPAAALSAVVDRVASGVRGNDNVGARRKSPVSNKRTKRTHPKQVTTTPRCPHPPGGALQLGEIGERLVLSFLPCLPDRMVAERVCKRWRRLSREDVPIRDLNFSRISMRKVSRSHLKAMLARAAGNLTRVSLPGFSLDDASLGALMQHTGLKHVRAYTMCRKQIFQLLEACTMLETLELLDCQLLIFTRWTPQTSHLRSIRFYACHAIRTPAIASMITQVGAPLKQLELTGAEYVDSIVFRALARYAQSLEDLTITYCRTVRLPDLQALLEARCHTLRLLDLSSCSGFNSFPDSIELTALEVLILDNTSIADDGLQAIAHVGSRVKYLSLQDCRNVTDQGVITLANCSSLELLDLKGTPVTDTGVEALDTGCPTLRMLRLDSCRGVARSLRLRHGEQTRMFLQCRMGTSYERMAVARIATPEQIAAAAAVLTSDSEGANDSDTSYEGKD